MGIMFFFYWLTYRFPVQNLPGGLNSPVAVAGHHPTGINKSCSLSVAAVVTVVVVVVVVCASYENVFLLVAGTTITTTTVLCVS